MRELRRTVVQCPPDTAVREIQQLARQYKLDVVFTVFTDTRSAKLAALIALQHIIEHDAEVLVVPHLTTRLANDQQWQAVVAAAEIITSDGPVVGGIAEEGT
ncbi:hypothetical protein ACFWPH_27550 [Nocardia sp. NPDC058499]|uniref:hypothetical protein n=1 Tax=Nocardia sp. NPDC058499 TaxID=3346530 RepID=UPI003666A260